MSDLSRKADIRADVASALLLAWAGYHRRARV